MRRTVVLVVLVVLAAAGLAWLARPEGDPVPLQGAPPPPAPPTEAGTARRPEPVPPRAGALQGAPTSAARGGAPEAKAVEDDGDLLFLRGYEQTLEGRVLDPDGEPLAGIPVYVGFAHPGYVHDDQRIVYARGADSEDGLAEARRYGGHAVTGAGGAYRVDTALTRGLSSFDGRVRVVPCHPAWMEPKTEGDGEGGDVRADRAAWLAVRVVGDEGAPLPRVRAIVREEARKADQGLEATDGGFVVQWRRGGDLPAEVDASVLVWAAGRRTERRRVRIGAEEVGTRITVDLGPPLAEGRLVLRPQRPEGGVGDRTVVVSLCLEEHPSEEVHRTIAKRAGEGDEDRHAADLPPGKYVARVWAWNVATEAQLLEGPLEVVPGATAERAWPTPEWRRR